MRRAKERFTAGSITYHLAPCGKPNEVHVDLNFAVVPVNRNMKSKHLKNCFSLQSIDYRIPNDFENELF